MIAHIEPGPPLRGAIRPPSSKNYTTRYLLVSCLADGESTLIYPAVSDDAQAMVECARTLGAHIEALDAQGRRVPFIVENAGMIESVRVRGFGASPHLTRPDGALEPDPENPKTPINPHNAGAVSRFLMALGALLPCVEFITDHPRSLGKRPNRDLLDALSLIGVEWSGPNEDGALPVTLRGGLARIHAALDRLAAEQNTSKPLVRVSGAVSSQFVSAMLFLAPLLNRDVVIGVTHKLLSRPLVETTLEVLGEAGILVESTPDCLRHSIHEGQKYATRDWPVHGDWPGASALLAAAAACPGSDVKILRMYEDLQGERQSLRILERMGCEIQTGMDAMTGEPCVRILAHEPPGALQAAAIDGDTCTDAVLALYGAAALARGKTQIYGIRNLQFKECDRIRRPLEELKKIYATLPEFQNPDGLPDAAALRRAISWEPEDDPDAVHIVGRPDGFEGGIAVDGCGDHRVIMMLSIMGLRCRKGLRILGAEDVSKSYPRWFEDLKALGARMEWES